MARIIPWTLPAVAGGSIGGYTERESGSGGDTPVIVNYFNFDDATFNTTKVTSSRYEYPGKIQFSAHPDKTITDGGTFVNGSTRYTLSVQGVQALELLGVSSVTVAITAHTTNYGDATIKLAYDFDTGYFTFINGSIPDYSYAYEQILAGDITAASWNVYNGSGEIIQNAEVTYS